MKKTVAFEKDITFNTKIGEITSISLDNDLTLKGERSITGSFYIKGTYKMLETSTIEEEYSYKIPCDIAISEEYDTFNCTIDIEDFTYEIINDEVLRVYIEVAINDLERVEEIPILETNNTKEIPKINNIIEEEELKNLIEEVTKNERKTEEEKEVQEERNEKKQTFLEVKENIKKEDDTYLTYRVYIFKETDTINGIMDKYKVSKEQLEDYNDLENITIGTKLVIPSIND